MAAKKAAAKKAAKKAASAPKADEKPIEATHESPISTTGAIPVYQTDLGQSLPAQKHPGVK